MEPEIINVKSAKLIELENGALLEVTDRKGQKMTVTLTVEEMQELHRQMRDALNGSK